jgi:ABC-type glutathione transport system ATPase component
VENDTVLEVRDLRMRYGSHDVLKGMDFTARQGEVVALLGPNGAGKTTTIEILEGLRMRSAGEVSVLGIDPAAGGEDWRARLCVVLQSWRDHAKWRVRELLTHLGSFYADYSTDRIRRPWDVDELIEAVGLTAHAQKRAGSPAGNGAGLTSRSASSAVPSCCSWTNRPPVSIRRTAASSTTSCTGSPTTRTRPSAHHARSRRGREARGPHPHPGWRLDHRGQFGR